MLSEIMTSIRAQLYERAVSPLMGSFIISWVIFNYKFVLLILSGEKIIVKYKIIDDMLFNTWQPIILQGLVGPMLVTAAYIFIYPHLAVPVFRHTREWQKEMNNIKKEKSDETLLTAAESRAVRAEIYKLEEELQKEISRKDNEIEKLRIELDTTENKQTLDNQSIEEVFLDTENETRKIISSLSKESIELLNEASLDPRGEILHRVHIGGTNINANNKSFLKSQDRREIAKWESNISDLLSKDILTKTPSGDVLKITSLGYEIADIIKHISNE